MTRSISLFEADRITLQDAIALSLESLREYGSRYKHWSIAYSGGKDSSAMVTFVAMALREKLVPPPQSVTVLYADTRMELPPLQQTAMQMLSKLNDFGFRTEVVLPALDDRFFVYMLGKGVPAPKNRFRWCTPQLKVEPMMAALQSLKDKHGKLLSITGVRLGESAARDQRIALSCSRDSGECGQGWFQVSTDMAVADTLAPLLQWRVCHVFDWLTLTDRHGFPDVLDIAVVYGEEDTRTGCVGCNLVEKDTAIERLIRSYAEWAHLSPLLELKPLYRELQKPKWRKRKSEPELCADGRVSKNVQRLGPLTMEAREYGLEKVLDIQHRARVDLINAEEETRIREMWRQNVWPRKWDGNEVNGDVFLPAIRVNGLGEIITQPILFNY